MTRDEYDGAFKAGYETAQIERDAIIEECAWAAQQWLIQAEQGSGEDLIDAIRALKDKP